MRRKYILLYFICFLFLFNNFYGQDPPNDGSPMGMNLHGIADWNREMPFQDLFKQSRSHWISQDASQPGWGDGPTPLDLDSLGWVKSLDNADHYVTSIVVNAPDMYIGDYHVYFDGEGTMTFSGSGIASYSLTEPGHYVVTKDQTGALQLNITETDPNNNGNYIRNIQVIPECFLSTYQTETFNPEFLELWEDFKVIRFMDWLHTNNSTIRTWDDRTTLDQWTQSKGGVAYEYIAEFCNIQQCDPWICIPHLADDNYVTKVAQLLKDSLDPNLKIYVEYSNEVWNGQFDQSVFAGDTGVDLGLAGTTWEAKRYYYAMRSVEIFDIFESVFSGTDRLVRVIAWQNFDVGNTSKILDYEIAPGDSTYEHTDAVAIAPYFGSFLGSNATDELVDDYPVEKVLNILEHAIAVNTNKTRAQYINAQSRKNSKGEKLSLIAYEGGQHMVGTFGAENNTALTALFHEANRHTRMGDIYFDYFQRWKQAGGEMFAVFSSMGEFSKWGSWGILEEYGEKTTAPKYLNTTGFLEANRPPWWTLAPDPTPPEGDLLISFIGDSIPSGCSFNRSWTNVDANTKYTPFSVANGDNIFTCPGYAQGEFYGGVWIESDNTSDMTKDPQLNDGNDEYNLYLSAGEDNHSKQVGLFMWRKDQFMNGYDASGNVTLGKLRVNCGQPRGGEVRFVIKNGSTYYISDWVTNVNGDYEISGIDNSSLPEKRWMVWSPAADSFQIPYYRPPDVTTPICGTRAVTFDDVQEIGFAYYAERESWGNGFKFYDFQAWTRTAQELSVTINVDESQISPTASSPINYTVKFNQPVSDFDSTDVTITGTANPTDVVVSESGAMDGTTYDVEVSGMSITGLVIADIEAGVASNSGNQNLKATTRKNTVQYNVTDPPTVTINQASGQADPDFTGPVNFTVVFSESMTGFGDAGDVMVSGTAGASSATITQVNDSTYDVEISDMVSDGTVIAEIPAGVAINAQGAANLASTSTDNTVNYYMSDPPQVTINQSAAQADPAFASNVHFTVVFNQPVTGFTTGDVTLSGTAGATTATVTEIAPNDSTTFNVEVSGMSSDGNIIATIDAGVAHSTDGDPNIASTSTDNEITFSLNMPTGGQLIFFRGDSVPSSNGNRAFKSSGTRYYMPFTTESDSNIYNTGDYNQGEFYGGIAFDWAPNPEEGYNFCRINPTDGGWEPNRFVCGFGSAGKPTRLTTLFMWKKEQFMNNMGIVDVGFDNDTVNSYMALNLSNVSGSVEMRFIVKNKNTYYISEFSAKKTWNLPAKLYELKGFGNTADSSKRWAVFNPKADSFNITRTDQNWQAVDFNDVREVGFIYTSYRDEYLNHYSFDTFMVAGITVVPEYDITFMVSDGSNPIENADVNFNSTQLSTNADGEVVFTDVGVGMGKSYNVTATGFQTASGSTDVVDADDTVYVTMTPVGAGTYTVTFNIDDGTDPIEGAEVYFDSITVNTNVSGVATFNGVEPGTSRPFSIVKNAYDTVNSTVDIVAADTSVDISMSLTKYTLTVNNGSGDGNFLPGSNVTVIASEAPTGQQFISWAGDSSYLDNPANDTTEITMPSSDVTITATYEDLTYQVTFTVNNSMGNPVENATVSLTGYGDSITSASGVALFSDIEIENNVAYSVTANGYNNHSGTISIVDQDITEDVTLILTTYEVTFNIIDQDNASVENASVELGSYGTQTTNATGTTTFANIEPDNGISYIINADGFEDTTGTIDVVSSDVYRDITLIISTGVLTDIKQNTISFYPNPVKNELLVLNAALCDQLIIMDILGNKIIEINDVQLNKIKINTSQLANGCYMMYIKHNKNLTAVGKFIKE